MTEQTTRLELIHRYQQIKQAVIDATDAGRPICAVQAGDLMALAEKLSIMEKTRDFIRELEEQKNDKPSGPFSGVTGF